MNSESQAERQMETLAESYEENGDYLSAARLWRQIIAVQEQELGTDHLDLCESLYSAGLVNFALDRYEAAEALLTRALTIRKRQLGFKHPDTLETMNTLVALYCEQDCSEHFAQGSRHDFLDCCSSLSLPYAS